MLLTEAAEQLLTESHRPEIRNEYGRTIVGGFSVTEGSFGAVRIAHATGEPDLLDPDRPSDDELAEARHRMVNAYAATMESAGWTVERRGARSRKPYLLVRI
ncbi:hypothetical protein PV402_39815 [Streptomyces scabiei]|uniref:hypothetical protein n=1 Tax=Streptomyces scabiei TaxID=1930 RepID=UPI0029B98665|nr:hypothetical protein [Streptomyces scabiei]MDX2658335.1 hypothetical protein [Streptomyces scabiei]MDX2870492.1 hypothetical protein [Streptomyces scabiei]